MIVLNIKQEDIKFTKHKNGNHYATIVVEDRKEPDQYENTHTVYNGQTKEQRAEKAKKEYCGNGKEFKFDKKQYDNLNKQELESHSTDLPF